MVEDVFHIPPPICPANVSNNTLRPGSTSGGGIKQDTTFEISLILTSRINPSITLQTGQGFNFKCISHLFGKILDL